MKRLLVLFALSSAALACDDDDGNPSMHPNDGGLGEARRPMPDMDASQLVVRVTNVGTSCSTDSMCIGDDARCADATLDDVALPGGYCTASCLSRDQCGPQGDCPFGELVTGLGIGHPALHGLTAGQCLQSCTELNQRSTCRDGYLCSNLAATNTVPVELDAFRRPVCLPIASMVDGGAHDASIPADATTSADAAL